MTSRKRVLVLLSTGLILILCAMFYVRYFLTRPIGSGPAGPVVEQEPFSDPWTEKAVHLVGLGDSITAGLGAASLSHTFFNRLIQNPDDEDESLHGVCLKSVIPNLTYENLAVSGSTSKDHLAVIEASLKPQSNEVYGLVVMTSGGNDLIHSYGRMPPRECAMYGASLAQAEPWIESFRARLETMFNKIEACFPGGCEIFIADIYDPTDGVGDAPSVYLPHWPDGLAIHARYNEVINEVAGLRENVHVVPLHQTFLGHGSHCRQFWRSTYVSEDPHYWFYTNIEDPNDRGYDAIRRVFLKEILKHSILRSSKAE